MNPSHRKLVVTAVLCLFMIPFAKATSHEAGPGTEGPDVEKEAPELLHAVSQGTLRIGTTSIDYTATAGTLEMLDEDGKPIAHFGYTA
ncbi:MAG: hypothetical protein AAGL66_02425, partial [Pseudomonadota bacterium]